MRRLIRKIMHILDGTPAEFGKAVQRGQSVVELALITPLLIILIIGTVEVGWFANNYLILLEVTRVGARRGAVLTGDNSPLAWDERWTLNPNPNMLLFDPFLELDGSGNPTFTRGTGSTDDPWPDTDPNIGYYNQAQWQDLMGEDGNGDNDALDGPRELVRFCPPQQYVGFYNLILCQMDQSLDPIDIEYDPTLPEEEQINDIVISVFAVQMVNNDTPANGGDWDFRDATYLASRENQAIDEFPDDEDTGFIPVVVGRYPVRANECNAWEIMDGANAGSIVILPEPNILERDPFDFINDGLGTSGTGLTLDPSDASNGTDPSLPPWELAAYVENQWVSTGYDPDIINRGSLDLDGYEVQRGFNYTGYHRIESDIITRDVNGSPTQLQLYCYGSEWDIYEIQDLMRGQDFQMSVDEIAAMRGTYPDFGFYPYVDPATGEYIAITGTDDVVSVDCLTGTFRGGPNNGQVATSPETALQNCYRHNLVNQGVILVEVFWEHELLLDFPVFSPIFNALGSDTTTISVWSAFPAPAASPNLRFGR